MSKYKAKRTIVDGITFDSKHEADRWSQLKLLERGGTISHLERQPVFQITINGKPVFKYRADFKYREKGIAVVEDAKGFPTPVYKLKKRIVEAQFGFEIREV